VASIPRPPLRPDATPSNTRPTSASSPAQLSTAATMERQRPRYPPSGGGIADLAPSTVISRPPRAPMEESHPA
jgi:hypothetical protein